MILNLSTGVYYSLDGAGGLVWMLLERGHSPQEAAARVAEHFDVEVTEALRDIEALIPQLLSEGVLVEDEAAESGAIRDDELPPAGDYAKPGLQIFTDMGDLLALDPPMPGLKEVPWRAPGG